MPGPAFPARRPRRGAAVRALLVALGVASTGLAVVGAFVPLLPTVPLLLVAAACFARSSETLHRRLLDHPRLGPVVRAYRDGTVPRRAKVTAVAAIWVSILASAVVVPLPWVRALLIAVAAAVTVYLVRLPTRARGPGDG